MTDARVSSAISRWAPRFVSNGVLLADFEDVTRSLERWEDWCSAWSGDLGGVSLGAPRAAAYEQRIKACIALSGPYEWDRIWEGLPALTREMFRVRSHARDEMQARAVAKTLTIKGRQDQGEIGS